MIVWFGVVVGAVAQTVVLAVGGILFTEVAISVMSIEALLLSAGAGFQATLGMRKADPEDEL